MKPKSTEPRGSEARTDRSCQEAAVQKSVEDYETAKFFELNIMRDSEKIGYLELFVFCDEDGDETIACVKSIELDEVHRNHGYGTAILKALAQEHDGIYTHEQ